MKALKLIVAAIGILFIIPGHTPDEAKIHWMTFEEAQAEVKKTPKKLLVDVYTKWCGPCKMMMASTFKDPKVIKYVNEHFYAIKFNAEGPDPVTFKGKEYTNPKYDANKTGRNSTHELTYQIAPVNGRVAYPTLVYFDENLTKLSPVQGFMKPAQIQPILVFLGEDHYKTTKFDEFKKSFVVTW